MEINDQSLSLIFDLMPDPAFFHDDQFRLLKANKAYFDIAGMVPDQALGKFYYEVFPKLSAPLPQCDAALHDPKSYESREEFTFGEKTFISYSYLCRDNDNKLLYVFHVLTDVRSLTNLDRQYKKIAAQFSILFSKSPDAIMLLDGQIFYDCNPATLRMFGCAKQEEFIGRHPSQFSPPLQPNGMDSMLLAKERISEAFKNGSNFFEWSHCKLDGTIFPAEVLLVAFAREGNQVLQATVRDITARKSLEAQLANTAEDLNIALADIITIMSKTMELRDPYTSGHQVRVAKIAV